MKEITNDYGDMTVRQGRKYYHVDSMAVPGILYVKRNEVLDHLFKKEWFNGFDLAVQVGEKRICQRFDYRATDRYIELNHIGNMLFTPENWDNRKKAVKNLKERYGLTEKQADYVFNSYLSNERIEELTNWSLPRHRLLDEIFPSKKVNHS